MTNWLTSPSWWKNYCNDDSDMTSRFTAAHQATGDRRTSSNALLQRAPGDDQRRLRRRRSTRSSPRPTRRRSRAAAASATRETGFTRQTIGGCGVWNSDANWANNTVVTDAQQHDPQRGRADRACRTSKMLDMQNALERPPAVREHGRPARGEGRRDVAERRAPSTRPSGSTRSAPSTHDLPARTSSRRTGTRTTGASSRCATACRQAYNGGAVRGGTLRARGQRAQRPGRAEHGAAVGPPPAIEYGAHLPLIDFGGGAPTLAELRAYARHADALGYRWLCANDHLLFQRPWLDGPTALAATLGDSGEMTLATTVLLPVHPRARAEREAARGDPQGSRAAGSWPGFGPGSSARDYEAAGVPFEERWPRFDAVDRGAAVPAAGRPAAVDREPGARRRACGEWPGSATAGWRRATTQRPSGSAPAAPRCPPRSRTRSPRCGCT